MSATKDRVHIEIHHGARGIEIQRSENSSVAMLLGGMEIAKTMILNQSIPTNPFATHIKDMKHTKAIARAKKVPKDEAMKIYMQLGQKIKERLQAMQKCDDVASFEIDNDLLTKL